MPKRKYPPVECPNCKSMDTTSKGWSYGRLRRYCKFCEKTFYSGEIRPRKIKPNTPPKTVIKPKCSSCGEIVCICKELARRKKLREKMKIALSLDSVRNVPCLFCVGNVPDYCVENCEDLENFLMGGL